MKNQVIYRHSAEAIVRQQRRIDEGRRTVLRSGNSGGQARDDQAAYVPANLGYREPRSNPAACRAPWYRAINWDVVFEWVCWAAFAACIAYLIIHDLFPFFMALRYE